MRRHRFRPRYHGVAWTAVGVGGALLVVASALGFLALPLATGVAGVAIGAAYLASPTWRLSVGVDDAGLEVGSARRVRFRLAWSEVARVVASPATHTCFVDGGAPERSLLVPGVGAPAPYDLEDRRALFDAILARAPADRVTTVESLERAVAAEREAAAGAAETAAGTAEPAVGTAEPAAESAEPAAESAEPVAESAAESAEPAAGTAEPAAGTAEPAGGAAR